MPTVHEIENALFALAPKETAMSWDNVGHLLGDDQQDVKRVLVALDITEDVAGEAIASGCELIVSHHPVMNCHWLPVQSVKKSTQQGHLLLKLLENCISAVCMHTNLDAAAGGVNDALAEALQLQDIQPLAEDGIGRMGCLKEPMTMDAFAEYIAERLQGNGLRYVDAGQQVKRIAVVGGAGGDYLESAVQAGCDTYVTADLSYHQFLDTRGKGLNLVDAGHFPTEDPVCYKLIAYLKEQFPKLEIQKSASHREVIQYYIKGES